MLRLGAQHDRDGQQQRPQHLRRQRGEAAGRGEVALSKRCQWHKHTARRLQLVKPCTLTLAC